MEAKSHNKCQMVLNGKAYQSRPFGFTENREERRERAREKTFKRCVMSDERVSVRGERRKDCLLWSKLPRVRKGWGQKWCQEIIIRLPVKPQRRPAVRWLWLQCLSGKEEVKNIHFLPTYQQIWTDSTAWYNMVQKENILLRFNPNFSTLLTKVLEKL